MDKSASRTAELVAAVRAGHRRHEGATLFDDPWAEMFLGPVWSTVVRYGWLYRLVSERVLRSLRPVQGQILLRAQFNLQTAQAAIDRGIRQFLLLGAGFDSFALRCCAQNLPVRVFELDHPATQQQKLTHLAAREVDLQTKAQTQFIAIDFERTAPHDLLLAHGWNPSQPAHVSWMGTTYYLAPEAIEHTLVSLRGVLCSGSEVIVDHGLPLDQLDPQTRDELTQLMAFVASRSEPMRSLFTPHEFDVLGARAGYEVIESLASDQIRSRLIPPNCPVPFSAFSRLVRLGVHSRTRGGSGLSEAG
ncbi:MAG: class I SAM-dependent methyltransferase [Limnohabitans sp.]|nr:class I SAM-dependent methyltransferase [Limnohabitans sp.]